MTIDLLTYQPKGVDYPLFRKLLEKHGNLFNQKFLYISEHYTNEITPDIDKFLITEYEKLGFSYVEPPYLRTGDQDWCDFALKAMLEKSTADIFLIIHPDFVATDFSALIEKVKTELEQSDLVGYVKHPDKLLVQPAFFACKRASYEKSCKDFSVRTGYDHCEYLTGDILIKGMKVKCLQQLGLKNKKDFYHIGGATQGYIWGLTRSDYRREKDYIYFYYALKANVTLNQIYVDRVTKILILLKEKFLNINPETHWLRRFLCE